MIHPTAIIENGATIADSVLIGTRLHRLKSHTIGEGTKVGNGSQITGKTTIGKNNNIFSNVVLGSAPQDLKYKGEETQLVIGDNNTIREFCFFNTGTPARRTYIHRLKLSLWRMST